MSEGENRDLSCERVMSCVARVVRRVLQGTPWRSVFERNGFGRQRFQLRPSLLERLHWESAPELGGSLPSLTEFQSIFPPAQLDPLRRCSCPQHVAARGRWPGGEPHAPRTHGLGAEASRGPQPPRSSRARRAPPQPHLPVRHGGRQQLRRRQQRGCRGGP